MARFSEVFRCSGVDESPNVPGKSKVPGMVVAAGGSNIVALEGGERLDVYSDNKDLEIEKIGDTAVIKLARLYQNFKLTGQDVDPQLRDSYMPHILSSNARFFKIHGKALVDAPGTLVQASANKLRTIFNRCKNTQADLTIFVVQQIQLKNGDQPHGTTDPEWNFCVLSSSHDPSTAAHEAGHYLFGEMGKDGKWHTLHHPWASSDPDKTPLMRDGGVGFKIQFDLALQARTFIRKLHGAGAGKKK